MIHLDTSFLIRALARETAEDLQFRDWLRGGTSFAISAIAWAEFLCGPLQAGQAELAARIVREQLPFLPEDAFQAARLFNLGGRRRGSLTDCMIAAIALRAGATLATSNPGDFHKLEPYGLRLATA